MSEKGDVHNGHRSRMWQKYLKNGLSGFEEHEIMEIILFLCLPRVNTNETAHSLINTFGSIKDALNAPISKLINIKGIGENAATQLRFLGELSVYLNQQKTKLIKMDASQSTVKFCLDYYKNLSYECSSFFLLDRSLNIIYKDNFPGNDSEHIVVDCSEIIRQALNYKCASVILAHNHSDGYAYTSGEDINVTRKLGNLLKEFGIEFMDHVIICGDQGYSLRSEGAVSEIWY